MVDGESKFGKGQKDVLSEVDLGSPSAGVLHHDRTYPV